jgi:hypothetical protein
MKKHQLDHVLRAAGRITGEKQFIIVGSQSLHGKYPDLPDDLVRSAEVDLIAKGRVARTEWLNAIGQDSPFHQQFGYYADPVDEGTAVLRLGARRTLLSTVRSPSVASSLVSACSVCSTRLVSQSSRASACGSTSRTTSGPTNQVDLWRSHTERSHDTTRGFPNLTGQIPRDPSMRIQLMRSEALPGGTSVDSHSSVDRRPADSKSRGQALQRRE